MSAGENAARAGLGESVRENRQQVAMTEESRVLLSAMLRDEMRGAVADGIRDAMTDDNAERFWTKGLHVLQEQAAQRAGLLVLGGLKKVIGIAAIVLAVYLLAGGPAAKAVLGAFTKG
jgi:hypothetical protein